MTEHPGLYLQRVLKELNWSLTSFADANDVSLKHIWTIVHGTKVWSAELAVRFEDATGIEAEQWMKAVTDWQIAKAREKQAQELEPVDE